MQVVYEGKFQIDLTEEAPSKRDKESKKAMPNITKSANLDIGIYIGANAPIKGCKNWGGRKKEAKK